MSKWTKRRPKSPEKGELSLFYFFKDEKTEEVWVVEFWPGRDVRHYKGLWASEPCERPEGVEAPPPVLNAPNKKRRGRGIL